MSSIISYAQVIVGVPFTIVGFVICIRWYLFWRNNYDGSLITHGPFTWVRHPFYSGFLVLTLGLAIWLPAPDTIALLVISIVTIIIYIPREEAELLERHKQEYEEYMKRVPWKLIPRVI